MADPRAKAFDLYSHAHAMALEDMQDNLEKTIVFLQHALALSDLSGNDITEIDRAMRSGAAHFKAALASLADVKVRRAAA